MKTKFFSKTLHLISLGCTKNLIDSEVMLGVLKDYTIIDDASKSDVIIINTCGFIEEAKKESIDTILEAHSQRKEGSVLVVSGCLTQRYKEELQESLPEVDLFTGVGDYDKIDKMLKEKRNIFSDEVFLASHTNERKITGSNYHAYVKISEGCNQKCSFCAIPTFKGKLNSRKLSSIAQEVLSLTDKGYYDFTFISQDSSSYGRDGEFKKDGLIALIKEIEKNKKVKSARILYLYPTTMSYELVDTILDSKIFHNYFDIPLQHASSRLLKTMKRGYDLNSIKKMLEYIKQKDEDAFLRTSFIVGHPTESKEDFDVLCDFIKEMPLDRISVFEYSDEEDTSAYDMKDKISKEEISKRLQIVSALVEQKIKTSFSNEIGKEIFVDINGTSDEHEYLLSAKKSSWCVDIDGEVLINDKEIQEELLFSTRYKAVVTQANNTTLIAKVIQDQC